MYDFSPKSIVPSSLGAAPDQRVAEAQQLLKQMGYDPGAIDGLWGPKTKGALAALWMAVGRSEAPPTEITDALLVELRAVAQRGLAQQAPAQPSLVEATKKPPMWQNPLLIGTGAVIGSIALYLMFREARAPVSGVEERGGEEDEPSTKPARKRKKKEEESSDASLVEKCPRVPEFEKGEVVAASAEVAADAIIDGEVLETTTVPAT